MWVILASTNFCDAAGVYGPYNSIEEAGIILQQKEYYYGPEPVRANTWYAKPNGLGAIIKFVKSDVSDMA